MGAGSCGGGSYRPIALSVLGTPGLDCAKSHTSSGLERLGFGVGCAIFGWVGMLGVIRRIDFLNLGIIEVFVGNVLTIHTIESVDLPDDLRPLITAVDRHNEWDKLAVQVTLARIVNLIVQGLEIVVLACAGPVDGKAGSITELHVEQQNRASVAV